MIIKVFLFELFLEARAELKKIKWDKENLLSKLTDLLPGFSDIHRGYNTYF